MVESGPKKSHSLYQAGLDIHIDIELPSKDNFDFDASIQKDHVGENSKISCNIPIMI